MSVRAVGLSVLAVLACGEPAVAPAPVATEPVTYRSARFSIEDLADLPRADIESLAVRVERDLDRVAALLPGFDPPPVPITLRIEQGDGIPFITPGLNRLTQWSESPRPQYFTHQLTHLFTRYLRTNFIEEGIAVWVNEQLRLTGELSDPYRAQPTHAWVSLFNQQGSAISLFTALRADNLGHDFRGSSADASAWQLFLEAGSFTGWFIEQFGFDRWLVFYQTGLLENAVGQDTPTLERAWIAYVTAAYPNPIACEDALGALDGREAFWCERARGQ